MRQLLLGILGCCLLLVGCNASEETQPTPLPPTPTAPALLQNYQGPSIGSLNSAGEESSNCTADSGCALEAASPIGLSSEALTLTQQTIGDFTIGIPEGYSPLISEKEILITATGLETEGGFIFSLRRLSEADLSQWLERFDQPDFTTGTPIISPLGEGQWLLTDHDGGIALFPLAETEDYLFIESFSYAGYWSVFQATFEAMLTSLERADS